MSANESNNKSMKPDGKNNPFLGAIKYKNDLPDPEIDCKFLPCGKSLMDYTVEPVSFPQLETNYSQHIKGLQMVLDIDLMSAPPLPTNETGDASALNPKDAQLLADIEPLHMSNTNTKAPHSLPTRAQECRELFAKERCSVPRPRTGLQRMQPEEPQVELEALSLEEQKQLINQTFVDIAKPLLAHPTKSNSKAHPIAVLPVLPHLSEHEFLQIQFGIPPTDNISSLLKDCGNYLINFRVNSEEIPQLNAPQPANIQNFVSDQRYKEERSSDTAERGEPMMLMERDGSLYYQIVHRHIKLRKERPTPQSHNTLTLLQVTFDGETPE